MEHYERLGRELIHKGAIIDYYQDTIKVPNGNIVKWDLITHKGAAAVVAVDKDGKLLMVRQYRNALDRETLEIPAGALDTAEEPTQTAAARELEEETGYKAGKLELLISLKTTVDLDELLQMIFDCKIEDAKTVSSLLAYKQKYRQ